MDSLSQAVLGASVAGVVAPTGYRRKAMLMGAALGTLPDLDVFIDYGDAVRNFTYHRGFSHSLIVLVPLSLALWLAMKHFWPGTRESQYRWLAAITLALATHPLLDAHTAYGTQLLWPLDFAPSMWATLFIIDPLFTLPLTIGVIAATIWPERPKATSTLRAGVVLSTLYVAWSWIAQAIVIENAVDSLAMTAVPTGRVFATPAPLNTFLWRVVIRTETGYLEGYDSLLADDGPIEYVSFESDETLLQQTSVIWSVARLRWSAHDLVKAEAIEDQLIISDLRMGHSPNFVFSHVVAERHNGKWQAVTTELLPFSFSNRDLSETWNRIWHSTPTADHGIH